MKLIKVKGFQCGCGKNILIKAAALDDEGNIVLIGTCTCGETSGVAVQSLLDYFFSGGNGTGKKGN